MAEIEIVEKDYTADCFELSDPEKDLKLADLIQQLVDAHLSGIAADAEKEAAKQAQRLLEDIVTHTTVELVGKDVRVNFDVHVNFWDGNRTLFAWKIIPEAEVEIDDDYEAEA